MPTATSTRRPRRRRATSGACPSRCSAAAAIRASWPGLGGPTVLEEDAALIGGQVLDEHGVADARRLAGRAVRRRHARWRRPASRRSRRGRGSSATGAMAMYIAFDLDAINASEQLSVAMPERGGLSVWTAIDRDPPARLAQQDRRIRGDGGDAPIRLRPDEDRRRRRAARRGRARQRGCPRARLGGAASQPPRASGRARIRRRTPLEFLRRIERLDRAARRRRPRPRSSTTTRGKKCAARPMSWSTATIVVPSRWLRSIEQLHDLDLVAEVEVDRRLVEDEDRRGLRDRHRQEDELALAEARARARRGRADARRPPGRSRRRRRRGRPVGGRGSGARAAADRAPRPPRPSSRTAARAAAGRPRAAARPRVDRGREAAAGELDGAGGRLHRGRRSPAAASTCRRRSGRRARRAPRLDLQVDVAERRPAAIRDRRGAVGADRGRLTARSPPGCGAGARGRTARRSPRSRRRPGSRRGAARRGPRRP